MNCKRIIKRGVCVTVIFLAFISVSAFGDELLVPMKQHIEGLLGARIYGFGEFGQIISILLAVLAFVGSIVGVVGYQAIKRYLSETVAEEIRLSDCISLVDLGMKYYGAYSIKSSHKDANIAALNSSIAVSEHALTVANQLSEKNVRKRSLKALIATNLAYFYADLAGLNSSEDTTKSSKERVASILNMVAFDVQVLERSREVSFQIAWYDVLESSLSAEFRTIEEEEHRKKILEKIDQLIGDKSLPPKWRKEIEEDWDNLR